MNEDFEADWLADSERVIHRDQEIGIDAAWVDPEVAQPIANSLGSEKSRKCNREVGTNPIERISILEMALAQCQQQIAEMKSRLTEQSFLEDILAKTEEAAYIQHQAITALKQKQNSLSKGEARVEVLEQTNKQLQSAVITAGAEAAAAKLEILHQRTLQHQSEETLRTVQVSFEQRMADLQMRIAQKERDLKGLQSDLNQSEELVQHRQDQISSLRDLVKRRERDLEEQQITLRESQSHLQETREIASSQQELIQSLQQLGSASGMKNKVLEGMSRTLLQSQNKIEVLESTLTNQRLAYNKLQHRAQEGESESLHFKQQSSRLERQVAEMQEQILQQLQQSHEFEAAVQHWKDRSFTSEASFTKLKLILEQLISKTGVEEFENLLSKHTTDQLSNLPTEHFLQGLKLNLPSFLDPRSLRKTKE